VSRLSAGWARGRQAVSESRHLRATGPWRVATLGGLAAPWPVLVDVFFGGRAAVAAILLLLLGTAASLQLSYRFKLKARARRFRKLVDTVEAILWEASAETFRISFLSHSAERLLGYPREQWLQEENFWERHLHPDDREQTIAEALAHIRAAEDYELIYRIVAADGRTVWMRDIVRVTCDATGKAKQIAGVSVDITHRKAIELSLRESESRKKAILDAALDCVITIDHEGRIVEFNPAAARTFGYPPDLVVGERMAELMIPPSLREAHDRGFRHDLATGEGPALGKRLELQAMHADGSEFPIELAITRVDLPGPPVFTAYVRDITDRKRAEEMHKQVEEELKRQALHDSLTGLPNRTLFHARGRHAIELARREASLLAVAIIDLDRFKEINDTLGHQSGDHVLDKVGGLLQRCLRESDTVARLGGDEFGVLFPCASRSAAIEVVEKIQRGVAETFTVDGVPLEIEASAGVALFPEHGTDVDLLLQRADVAMYVAKGSGAPFAIYDPDEDTYEPGRLALGAELRQALDRRELALYYQPQVDLRTEQVTGAEALLRWAHPKRGLLPPSEFIPFAEHTGLMKPITLYVLDEALRQYRAWERAGTCLNLSVNVSMRNLIDVTLPTAVEGLLRKWGVEAEHLTLEITESAIAADRFRVGSTLKQLTGLGVRLSVDDFGTGYSSMDYLRRLHLGEIKIDRSFVIAMSTDEEDAIIVRSMIDLARNLGLHVVAEGVETEETYELLRELRCDTAQGAHLSRPLPADELVTWLAGRSGPRVDSSEARAASA
jgi:diguanylate cyclase (GGDEF)-like protein/PAS domain S-box-containing protein